MEDPMAAIRETFFQECEEQLAKLETGLIAMENGTTEAETVNAVFRAVHSMKGKGMINLRGTVLVVIDLAERLGLPTQEPSAASVVVVVEHGDKVAGLLVDAVCDIITVTDDMRQPTPETGTNTPREFVEGLIMMENRIVSIVAIAALMPDTAVQALLEAA
jgi:chemotaxis signal transduction protein